MPYSLEHQKIMEATRLAAEVSAWEKRGAKPTELPLMEYSSNNITLKMRATNVIFQQTNYEVVLALDCQWFQNKGILLGAKGGAVLWEGTNGQYQVIRNGRGLSATPP
jgi:hypothetical protein